MNEMTTPMATADAHMAAADALLITHNPDDNVEYVLEDGLIGDPIGGAIELYTKAADAYLDAAEAYVDFVDAYTAANVERSDIYRAAGFAYGKVAELYIKDANNFTAINQDVANVGGYLDAAIACNKAAAAWNKACESGDWLSFSVVAPYNQ